MYICVLTCQLHWSTSSMGVIAYTIYILHYICVGMVNFVHGVIASILIYEFVCMCPHVSVTLVSTGQLRPWGDSYSILIYEFVCIYVSSRVSYTGQLRPWG